MLNKLLMDSNNDPMYQTVVQLIRAENALYNFYNSGKLDNDGQEIINRLQEYEGMKCESKRKYERMKCESERKTKDL